MLLIHISYVDMPKTHYDRSYHNTAFYSNPFTHLIYSALVCMQV